MGACEPGQVRKEAALSGYFHVPWGCSTLRSYREVISAELMLSAFFLPASGVYTIIFMYAQSEYIRALCRYSLPGVRKILKFMEGA